MSTDNITNVDEPVGSEETIEAEETSTGLEPNVAAALSYLLGPITGIAFYLLEKENAYVRYHAAQSTLFFGGMVVLSILTSIFTTVLFIGDGFITGGFIAALISLVISLFWLVLSVVLFVAWLYLMFRAYQGKRVRIPLVGKRAERMV